MLSLLLLALVGTPAAPGSVPQSAAAGTETGPTPPAYATEIDAAVGDVVRVYPVPAALVKAVIREESACDPNARSRAGAVGLMQVMPANAEKLGVSAKELVDPLSNIVAGTRLLAALLQHYRGDVVATLVAYNSGPRRKRDPLPKNGETPTYVLDVLRHYRWFSKHEAAGPCSPLP